MDKWNSYRRISGWIIIAFACVLGIKVLADILILLVLPLGDYQARTQFAHPFGIAFIVASIACAALLKLLEYHYLGSLAGLRAEKGRLFRFNTSADMLEMVKSDSPQFKDVPDAGSRGLIYRRSIKLFALVWSGFVLCMIFRSAVLQRLCMSRFG